MNNLNVLLTGANGFLGSQLKVFLQESGVRVFTLGRRDCDYNWDFVSPLPDLEIESGGFDAVIHLAGATVQKRWTASYIRVMHESRVLSTRYLVEAMNDWTTPPSVFLCASAVGYYGYEISENEYDEGSEKGRGILASLCVEWESEVSKFVGRSASMRFGVILGSTGGMLKKLLPIYKLGMGGKLGSGQQALAWVSLNDAIRGISSCLTNKSLSGAVNIVSPDLINQEEFAKVLGRILNRPLLGYSPAFVIKLLLGVMGEELALGGRKVLPLELQKVGFLWEDEKLEAFLEKALK